MPWITGGLRERHQQVQREVTGNRLQIAARPLVHCTCQLPFHTFCSCMAGSCKAWSGTIQALGVIKTAAIDIAQCQVREINVAEHPRSPASAASRVDALPKECQLKAESMAVRRFEIAGVIPPLGFVVGMIEVIAREFVADSPAAPADTVATERQRDKEDKQIAAARLFFMHYLNRIQRVATRAG